MKKLLALLLAMLMAVSMLTAVAFAEPGDVTEIPEEPDTTEIPEEPASDPNDSRDPMDRNPGTGISLAVLPMVMAAAGVVLTKKH